MRYKMRRSAGAYQHLSETKNIPIITPLRPLHLSEHLTIIMDPGAYSLAVLALRTGSPVDISKFNKADCFAYRSLLVTSLCVGVTADMLWVEELDPNALLGAVGALPGLTLGFLESGKVLEEPALQPYVCSRGFSTDCGAAF